MTQARTASRNGTISTATAWRLRQAHRKWPLPHFADSPTKPSTSATRVRRFASPMQPTTQDAISTSRRRGPTTPPLTRVRRQQTATSRPPVPDCQWPKAPWTARRPHRVAAGLVTTVQADGPTKRHWSTPAWETWSPPRNTSAKRSPSASTAAALGPWSWPTLAVSDSAAAMSTALWARGPSSRVSLKVCTRHGLIAVLLTSPCDWARSREPLTSANCSSNAVPSESPTFAGRQPTATPEGACPGGGRVCPRYG